MGRLLARAWRWFFGWPTYEHYLESRRWRWLRWRAKRRDGGRCRICNADWPLQVHHRQYPLLWGLESVKDLTTLCAECHRLYEWFRFRRRKEAV